MRRKADEAGGDATEGPIRVGISACLLGREVRYDGGHKRDSFLTDTLGRFVEWVPVCPEEEAGLGVPREAMRLVDDGGRVRLLTVRTGVDHTRLLRRFSADRVEALAREDICGFVLKKNSPSCGLERVKLYSPAGGIPARGRGLFAAALTTAFPLLPLEEEGRLCDPGLRENFVERLFAYRRLRSLFAPRWTTGDLVAFHTRHKLQLLSHSRKHYDELGRVVAGAKRAGRESLRAGYEQGFMECLRVAATPGRHANVLEHMLGYFRDDLDADSRRELLSVVSDYRRELVPLVVPMTLFRHYVRKLGIAYLREQTYLEPHPKELMLRNHV